MKHFINLKDIPSNHLKKIIADANKTAEVLKGIELKLSAKVAEGGHKLFGSITISVDALTTMPSSLTCGFNHKRTSLASSSLFVGTSSSLNSLPFKTNVFFAIPFELMDLNL